MLFRGAGWNVIKVVWGREWDELLARDVDGVLVNKMNTTVDGEFQKYATSPAPTSVSTSSGRIRGCRRWSSTSATRTCNAPAWWARLPQAVRGLPGGDRERGQPDGDPGQDREGLDARRGFEARNATHQIKKMTPDELKPFRDRLYLEIPDADLETRASALLPPRDRLTRVRVHDVGARALDGSIPERVVPRSRCRTPRPRCSPSCSPAPARSCRRRRRPRSPGCPQAAADPEHRPPGRADHPRRGAHVRARRAVP